MRRLHVSYANRARIGPVEKKPGSPRTNGILIPATEIKIILAKFLGCEWLDVASDFAFILEEYTLKRGGGNTSGIVAIFH